MRVRFVVLWHIGSPDGDHYDLLVEREPAAGDLETFRVPAWPVTGVTDGKRLRDHRRAYLTYQGQVSGDRGSVVRVAEGTATVHRHGGGVRLDLDSGRSLEIIDDPSADEGGVVIRDL